MLHCVLYQPEIPQNAGNIGRTCVALGAKLWMVRPLGFHLDEKHLKRAAMDYWQYLDYEVVDDWAALLVRLPNRRMWFLSKHARRLVWDAELKNEDVFVFGSESSGLPREVLRPDDETSLTLPMRPEVRSLNLASTVNTVLYEATRQIGTAVT